MIKQNATQRKSFWEEVIKKVKDSSLDSIVEITITNTIIESSYRYVDVKYKGDSSLLQDRNVLIQLNVACELGKVRAIPKLNVVFIDGEDVSRRDTIYSTLKKELPQYHYERTHTNQDGLSKIIVRRKKDSTRSFNFKDEAEILVNILKDVFEVL